MQKLSKTPNTRLKLSSRWPQPYIHLRTVHLSQAKVDDDAMRPITRSDVNLMPGLPIRTMIWQWLWSWCASFPERTRYMLLWGSTYIVSCNRGDGSSYDVHTWAPSLKHQEALNTPRNFQSINLWLQANKLQAQGQQHDVLCLEVLSWLGWWLKCRRLEGPCER